MTTDTHIANECVFVVVPAFNEGRRLGRVLERVRRDYRNVVVVDDGSSDRTGEVGRSYDCFVLRHVINRGQGAALQTGITFALRAGARYVVTFDADGQHQPEDVPALLAPLLAGECDVCLGNRFLNRRSNVPALRRILLQAGRVFTYVTSGLRVGDTHNGFRAFTGRAAEAIDLKQDRMAHASEVYDQIRRSGLSFREVPVTIHYTAETLHKGQRLSNSISVVFQYLYGKVAR